MYYGAIKNCDIANGEGVRVTLFVSGCRNGCKGCFQKQTWDFCYGTPFTETAQNEILAMLEPSYIAGLTLLGGEPMEPENQRELLPFLKRVKDRYPNKNVWMFTGFTFEELHTDSCRGNTEYSSEILSLVDVLVDGRFEQEKKSLMLKFRGSENQRLIDVKRTLASGEIVTIE